MNKILSLLVLLLIFTSCNEDDCGCTNFDIGLNIKVMDANGIDLINESNFSDIQINYLVDGVTRPGVSPFLIDDEFGPRIGITLNNDSSDEYPVTYVKWNDEDTDTIKASFKNNNRIVEQIWINDQLINPTESPGYFYTLIKE